MVMNLISTALIVIYPFLIYFGLSRYEPRILGLLLAVIALLRWRRGRNILYGLGWEGFLSLIVPFALAIVTAVKNDEITLKLYPVAVNIALLIMFGVTLFKKQTMVERIARIHDSKFPIEGVKYTRRVTEIWCVFFAINGLASLCTAFLASREVWTIYNGLIAYIIMGIIFGVEWLYRHHRFQSEGAS